jgi:hypothetical protein
MEKDDRATDVYVREQLVPIALTTATTKTPVDRLLTEKDFLAEIRRSHKLGPDGKPRYFCRVFLSGHGPVKGRHVADSDLYSDPRDAPKAVKSVVDYWIRQPASVLVGMIASRPEV